MKVFITGGAGFIGSLVGNALLERGDEVFVFDNFDDWLYRSELKEARLKEVYTAGEPSVWRGDVTDQDTLTEALEASQPEVILHFAALANPGRSVSEAERYTKTNVLGTLNLLTAAQKLDIPPRFVVAGSSSVYNDEQTPFQENSYPLRPRSPYGASKAAMETYFRVWNDLYNFPTTILRFFSVWGPWGRPDMAPMVFAQKILTGEAIHLVEEDRERDFTHIDDVVPAIISAVDKDLGFEIINVGRGEPQNIKNLISVFAQAAGKEAQIEPKPTPLGEMKTTYADVTKAKELLDYRPKLSINDQAHPFIDWMRDYYLPRFS